MSRPAEPFRVSEPPLRRFASLCLLGAVAAQGLCAIAFFYAANWWDMTATIRIGALMAALMACAVFTAISGSSFARSAWAVAGALLCGVLFAVHGQIWQTGANAWELFAVWALLALIWAVLTEWDVVWAVVMVVAVTGVWLWDDQTDALADPSHAAVMLLITGVVLGCLALRYARSALPGARRTAPWSPPLFGGTATVFFIVAAVVRLTVTQNAWDCGFSGAIAGAVTGVVLLWALPPRRFGLWPFTLGLILAVILSEAVILRLLARLNDGRGPAWEGMVWLLTGALILAGLALFSTVLWRVVAGMSLSVAVQLRLHQLSSLGVGIGAWIATVAVAIGLSTVLVVVFSDFLWQPLVFAAMFALVANFLSPHGQFSSYLRGALNFGTYCALVVQVAVLCFDGGVIWNTDLPKVIRIVGWSAFLLLWPLFLFTRDGLAGTLTAMCAVLGATLAVLTWYVDNPDTAVYPLVALACLFAALGSLVVWRSSTTAMRAAGVVFLASAFLLPILMEVVGGYEVLDGANWTVAARLTAAGLAAAYLILAVRKRPDLDHRFRAAGVILLLASLLVPAGAAGLVAFGAVALLVIGRPLVLGGFLLAAYSVSRFYYSLEIPLDEKALYLAIGAALTLAAWWVLRPEEREPWVRRPAALGLALICAVVPIGLEAADAGNKARIVAEGRQVLLPLRPVDPRSLLQGDYMALAYGLEGIRAVPNMPGQAVLTLDDRGVAETIRPGADADSDNDVVVRVRPGAFGMVRIAPTSFLFPERAAATFERAAFAVVRIRDGALVLTGLADRDRILLTPDP